MEDNSPPPDDTKDVSQSNDPEPDRTSSTPDAADNEDAPSPGPSDDSAPADAPAPGSSVEPGAQDGEREGTASKRSSERVVVLSPTINSSIASKATPIFQELTRDTDSLMPVEMAAQFLREIELDEDAALLESFENCGIEKLTLEDVITLLSTEVQPSSPTATSKSSPSKAPLKKALSQNRDYMETGSLAVDETVLSYVTKLDDHRKKCESEGRYAEAKAANLRLADLKTAQVERLRTELMQRQAMELEDVHNVYAEEMVKFNAMWSKRVREYDLKVAQSVEGMRTSHQEQGAAYEETLLAKTPTKPKHSRDYLNQKKIEESLVKVKLYTEASQVRNAAAEIYETDLEQTHMMFDADVRLKLVKQQAKQQLELEALLRRGQKGRDELLLRRTSETEQRNNRFRNIVAELRNLHNLEIVHLENFLDGQVRAGKAVPLKDGFQRKREALLSTRF